MRRRVSLYIVDRLVDLDDESFILFNWAQEDLSNPTVVKNSYTQQITLKGTPGNNAIFGDYFRVDRRFYDTTARTGVGFNPSARTPFTLYNELNEVLQSGYVKLDQVSVSGQDIQYQVTLYGGLGSFFYALSYDDEGNKRTLADLDYLGLSNPASELDFMINASSVRAAWNSLGSTSGKWSVVNFAPCYNGIPEGNFSADKALGRTTTLGLQDTYREDDREYRSNGGYTLISFENEYDEWAVKDLRSYLQRPVFSIRAFLEAVCNPDNNGGYDVDMSALEASSDFPYQDLWMTLPMLPDVEYEASSQRDLTLVSSGGTSLNPATFTVPGTVASGAVVNGSVSFYLQYTVSDVSVSSLELYQTLGDVYYRTVLFIQVVACDSAGSIVGGSLVKSIFHRTGVEVNYDDPADMAVQVGFTPWYQDGDSAMFENTPMDSNFISQSSTNYRFPTRMDFSVEAQNAEEFEVRVAAYIIMSTVTDGVETTTSHEGGTSSAATFFRKEGEDTVNLYEASATTIIEGTPGTAIVSADTIRSNAEITKATLLTTEYTPAEYLLSFCKMFGLVFTYDNASRKITVMRRNDFYQDETVDLTDRVDRSQDITVRPITFDAKWYVFSLESDGGEMSDRYKGLYGQAYGIQRVNTGYDFDANTTELLDGSVFRSAVTVLESSKYFNTMENLSGRFQPSVFQDKGSTYSLYDSDMESVELDVPVLPRSASVTYFNTSYPGYDILGAGKLQLHDGDGKPADGLGVLLMRLSGSVRYPYFDLTDDDPRMFTLNVGEPCWSLEPGPSSGISVPRFSGYMYGSDMSVVRSLDFGVPQELYIPGLEYPQGSTIYAQAWQKYLADRYDVNTKVMTCRVDFRGMQVGQELLRKFYYYGGSLWVINSISNYSMTTWDLAEVELVQVQDKDNYLNGQY